MAKTASRIPVLWESLLRVLWILFAGVFGRNKGNTAFWADPCADSATCALVKVE
jgi:hypothetical protein